MYNSDKQPRIDWGRAWYHIDAINNSTSLLDQEKHKLTRAQAELAFIRSTRAAAGGSAGLKSGMERIELFEFLLRAAAAWVGQVYSSKEEISSHLEKFLGIYVRPFVDTSVILV